MSDINKKLEDLTNTKDVTGQFSQEDINNNKVMAILAYMSWLVLVPLFGAKNSKFARFHCNQGLVLAIFEVVIIAFCGILSRLPLIGWVFDIVEGLLGLVFFVFVIIGVSAAASGKAKELPIIGGIKLLD